MRGRGRLRGIQSNQIHLPFIISHLLLSPNPMSHPDLSANPNARIHVHYDQVTHMHRLSEYQNTV
jgi:hypothetical protein